MSLWKNLQYLRKINRNMTQEALAEKLSVSRQTVSRWELGDAFPEMEKLLALCDIFACTLDELVRSEMGCGSEAYSDVQIVKLPAFRCCVYPVISTDPETDALTHQKQWAEEQGIQPDLIGWDFPVLSQEQINVYHMHGYTAGCILPENFSSENLPVIAQREQRYAMITVKEPFISPFTLIPNAYKTAMRYLDITGISHKDEPDQISCFEKEYEKDGTVYMDIYLMVE